MPREQVVKLKAIYTVPELARMGGVTRWEMRRALVRAGIPIDDTSRPGRVLLTDLRAAAPKLWDSIVLAAAHDRKQPDEPDATAA